jgi:hypothetical protein
MPTPEELYERAMEELANARAEVERLSTLASRMERGEELSESIYPDVIVRLVGENGNAFSILQRVDLALRDAGVDSVQRAAYRDAATSGDYDNLLRVTMEWVTVY